MYVYLPSQKSGNEVTMLRQVGLESLHDDGLSLESADVLGNGPDGGFGVVIGWGRPGRITAVRMHSQTWHRLAPRGELLEGRAWIGWDNDTPPTPDTLARKKQVGTRVLPFADENFWLIPTVDAMPKVIGIDQQTGVAIADIAAEWKPFINETEALLKVVRVEDMACWIDIDKGFTYVCSALSKNYRVCPELVAALGLVKHDHFISVPANVLRYDLLPDELAA